MIALQSEQDFLDILSDNSNILPLTCLRWNEMFWCTHVEDDRRILNPFHRPNTIAIEDGGFVLGNSEELGLLMLALFEDGDFTALPLVASSEVEGAAAQDIQELVLACLSQELLSLLLSNAIESHKRETSPSSFCYLEYYRDLHTTDTSGVCRLKEPIEETRVVVFPDDPGRFFLSLPATTSQESLDKLGSYIAKLRSFVR